LSLGSPVNVFKPHISRKRLTREKRPIPSTGARFKAIVDLCPPMALFERDLFEMRP
jgi:hypothetical protein